MTESPPPLATAILLLIFNRPLLTQKIFEPIRLAKPRKLFIAGDGPRPDHPEEIEAVERSRSVVDMVDWECDVRTLFRASNLGCARAVSSAIDWAFENVDELIVLEDDCLPAASFFPFCTELLERYRDDERVFVISGDNFQPGPPRTPYSYYFSRFNHCWGWATWRRAWEHFDFEMVLWPEIRAGGWLRDVLQDPSAEAYWEDIFESVYQGNIDSWAYRWTFVCWIQSGLTVLPTQNLVENVGFGEEATHTRETPVWTPNANDVNFPLRHPSFVIRDARADNVTQSRHFNTDDRRSLISHFMRAFGSLRS